MDNLYNMEHFYIAGIGLLLNLFLFAITLLIYLCKPRIQYADLESLGHLQYQYDDGDDDEDDYDDDRRLNIALLHENQNHDRMKRREEEDEKGLRLIDLIPAMKFIQLENEDRESNCDIGCSICLIESYEDDDLCKVLPECNHVFHSWCIDQWLMINQSCPVCRKVFGVVDLPKS